MDITAAAIKNNRTTAIALLLVVLAGFGSYLNLPRAEDPGFIIRTAQIVTVFPGASPERVENLVTDPLEKAIKEMPELDFMTSQSKTGVSIIFVNVRASYKQMRPIWDSLRRKVAAVSPTLPDGVFPPEVNDEFGDVFGTMITITGEGYDYRELKDVADDVRDQLLRLSQVGKVEIVGAQDERVFVEYDNSRLSKSGLTPFQLGQILTSRNIIIPGGSITTGDERIVLEPSGNFESIDELKRTVINVPGQGVIFLEDLADIRRGYVDPPANMARANGDPALLLAISLRDGGNITTLGDETKGLVRELEAVYPIGVEFDFAAFQAEIVNEKVDGFVESLLQSIGIVMLVMLLTLGPRTGLLVSALIPTTMLVSILLMSAFDIGLDQISIASLIIALGMLVDNAIVMSESIMVMMERGKTAAEAAIASAKELRIPLLVASLTTSASFLPIFLAKSTVGEYTASIFKVVTIALLSSWVLALTMTPLLCVLFLKVKQGTKSDDDEGSAMYRVYHRILMLGLRHRLAAIAVTIIVFFFTMSLFPKIPFQFFPPSDRPMITAELKLPDGTPIERTEEIVKEFEDHIQNFRNEKEGVVNWAAFIGQGAPRYNLSYAPEPPSPNYAYFIINVTEFERVAPLIPQFEKFLGERYPDLIYTVRIINLGPPVTKPVQIRISGKNADQIFDIVDTVKKQLATIEGTKNIEDNWGARTKKLLVDINQPRARRARTSNQEIAYSLQTVLSGISQTQYREDEKVIPITLRSVSADRQDLGKIESLDVYTQSAARPVPLKQVADLEIAWEASRVLRRDQYKTVTVSNELLPGTSSLDVINAITPWLEEQKKSWPVGYDFAVGGELEEANKGNASIMEQLPVAGIIIVLLLVGQFNSIRRASIVLMTIPLGVIGVIYGLLIARSYFGFMTLLGIISLAGIVINNAIVLLDRIRLEIESGQTPQEAVLRATRLRMRPILLTTATTVGGLLPLWFGGGLMFEPMAIAIIFGMLFSTVLTLGVVPILYSLFFGVRYT